jgi:hypothetical protein
LLNKFQVVGADTGRQAKFYTLTKAGNKQLAAEEEGWDRFALAIAKVRKAVLGG